MKSVRIIAAVVAMLFFQGCAFTDAKLKVAHNPAANVVGPIVDVNSLQFSKPQLDDKRLDKARIGWKKNGYGANTANIFTDRPVDAIIENAIADALEDNKHTIGDNGRILISGSVDRFWFETDVNFWTVKFIGDVQCTLEFVDTQTNTPLYKSAYSGNYSETKGGGLEKTWAVIMGKAVDKLIESVVLDDELAEALKGVK